MQLLMSVLQSRNHVVDRAHHRRLPVGCGRIRLFIVREQMVVDVMTTEDLCNALRVCDEFHWSCGTLQSTR